MFVLLSTDIFEVFSLSVLNYVVYKYAVLRKCS